VVTTDASTAQLHRLTITAGHSQLGAGIRAVKSDLRLQDVVVAGNASTESFETHPTCVGTGVRREEPTSWLRAHRRQPVLGA